MTILKLPIITLFIGLSLLSCANQREGEPGPKEVKLEKTGSKYTLTVDGEPFFVKGAGLEFGNIGALASHGANAFRTWRTENGKQTGKEVLDAAYDHGLMVCMGLEVGRERHGFDYNDPEAVKEQLEYLRGEVRKYRDHPALLVWGIGNELNLRATNPAVWDAVDEIARMIHKEDPNHPVTTMLAGFSKELGEQINERCPNIDFLSFQFYADIVNLPKYLKEANYQKPYLVTEWGATGHWESPLTDWGRPIEQNSTEKADSYLSSYETVIAADPDKCLGSFVFLWGQKQERTPTWYGMFLENGDETASVDVMHYVWNGEWPANRTPRMDSLLMNGMSAYSSVRVKPGQNCSAEVFTEDPDGDEIKITWDVMREVPDEHKSDGGDFEKRPESVATEFNNQSQKTVDFIAPSEKGEYRLFVYVSDGNGHSATANIPFLVQ
jgi:hypothetical protein